MSCGPSGASARSRPAPPVPSSDRALAVVADEIFDCGGERPPARGVFALAASGDFEIARVDAHAEAQPQRVRQHAGELRQVDPRGERAVGRGKLVRRQAGELIEVEVARGFGLQPIAGTVHCLEARRLPASAASTAIAALRSSTRSFDSAVM